MGEMGWDMVVLLGGKGRRRGGEAGIIVFMGGRITDREDSGGRKKVGVDFETELEGEGAECWGVLNC